MKIHYRVYFYLVLFVVILTSQGVLSTQTIETREFEGIEYYRITKNTKDYLLSFIIAIAFFFNLLAIGFELGNYYKGRSMKRNIKESKLNV